MEYLKYGRENEIGTLEISRPKELNALNRALLEELLAFLQTEAQNPPRCMVLTGSGEKAFVAGADIAEMQGMTREQARHFSRLGNEVMHALEGFPCPVIAAVNGYALGGGFELALACDIRLAADNAVFSFPEVGLGIMPGFGGLQRAARLVGAGRAKELAYTARRVKAQQAAEMGLVNAAVPAGELRAAALEMAGVIAAQAPIGVSGAKRAINEGAGAGLREAAEAETIAFAACFETRDQQDAMAAFTEKRKPAPFVGK